MVSTTRLAPDRPPDAPPSARADAPLIEIRGPWLHNKGDVLMLRAAVDALADRFALAVEGGLGLQRLPPDAGVESLLWGAVEDARLSKGWMTRTRRATAWRDAAALALLPDRARAAMRLRDGRAVSGLLDVSGFAYGDQWGPERGRRRTAYYTMLKRRGVRLAMAPQAFGPFERAETRRAARALMEPFDRIYARDERSLEHLLALGLPPDRIAQAPDITHRLRPPAPPPGDWGQRACVVPNARMLDRTGEDMAEAYIGFVLLTLRLLREAGADPFVMLHEANDVELGAEVARRAGGGLEVVDPAALEAKAILGACRVVVGSRYHALIGSLSQATPTIGTSWSHKYTTLFEEYGCPDMLVTPLAEEGALRERLHRALDPQTGEALRADLRAAAGRQARQVAAMWDDLRGVLAGPVPARVGARG